MQGPGAAWGVCLTGGTQQHGPWGSPGPPPRWRGVGAPPTWIHRPRPPRPPAPLPPPQVSMPPRAWPPGTCVLEARGPGAGTARAPTEAVLVIALLWPGPPTILDSSALASAPPCGSSGSSGSALPGLRAGPLAPGPSGPYSCRSLLSAGALGQPWNLVPLEAVPRAGTVRNQSPTQRTRQRVWPCGRWGEAPQLEGTPILQAPQGAHDWCMGVSTIRNQSGPVPATPRGPRGLHRGGQ